MMELKVNVPEVRSYINEIVKAPGNIDVVRYNVQESVGKYLSYLIPHSGVNSPQLAANFKRIFKFDTPSACGGAVYWLGISMFMDSC